MLVYEYVRLPSLDETTKVKFRPVGEKIMTKLCPKSFNCIFTEAFRDPTGDKIMEHFATEQHGRSNPEVPF